MRNRYPLGLALFLLLAARASAQETTEKELVQRFLAASPHVRELAAGVAAWVVGDQRDQQGAFVTTLAPVQTDGYAVVVPDVAGVFARHGIARLLGDGRLTINVRSTSPDDTDLIVVALVPAGDATRYLSGTARTEVGAVGYSTGVQPVQSIEVPGEAPTGPAPWPGAAPSASRRPASASRIFRRSTSS